ncbi:LysR family transcriptional regulator [Opitutus sp. GAS368]|uniref:LysR family transcriptional regulator n=1 Tax=Opitutus sp. GAS368 TaxID=1882749 RepID=UPI00087AAD2D|nr:LysR family transcriptional regulator [Opitutus sp. GAS368]SDS46853.1 DNA-binding transcriptional regulator, LysR family [Opitutus sp. GAS368]
MFRPHQLELFYYVARYGGISAAVRHIPYGIGQPAVSGQLAALERMVGASLFDRRPFQLTEQGRHIYNHVRPFHEKLGALWERVRGRPDQTVRLAVAGFLDPEFLALVLAAASPRPEGVRYELLTGQPDDLVTWVRERRVRLAVMPSDRRAPLVSSRIIGRAGLHLLVSRRAGIRSAQDLWGRPKITEPLICPPETDPVGRSFVSGLKALHVKWASRIWVESPRALLQLVAEGQGVGVGLDLPWATRHPAVRALPLTGFASVPLVVLWRKPVDPLLQSLLTALDKTSRKLWRFGL